VLLALLGFANGYSRPGPTSIVGDVAPPDARGVAVAGYRTAGDVGALVGPIVVGLVAEHFGYGPAFVAIGAVGALAFIAAVLARETAPNRRAAAPARA
jgi:MFS family permease